MLFQVIRFGTSGWRVIINDKLTPNGVRAMTQAVCEHLCSSGAADTGSIIGYDTRFIGESINEVKIILDGEESAGLAIKGHYPEKDGVPACLRATEAVAARGARLREQLAVLYSRVGRRELGGTSLCLTSDPVASLPEKLRRELAEISARYGERVNQTMG